MKLYEILYHHRSGTYAMVDFLTVFPYYRDEVRNMDLSKLQPLCDMLNRTACSDERFSIQEVERDKSW